MSLTRLFNDRWPGTVLFDLDGTLVDSAPDLAVAVDDMLHALDRPTAGEDKVRDWVGNGAGVLVHRALADRFDYQSDQAPDDLFDRARQLFFDAYRARNGSAASVYPGILPFLEGCRDAGTRLGVVTNKPLEFTGPLLEQMDLAHWFEVVVGGDSLPVKKPDPEPLFHACRELGGDPATCLMVGDSINDIEAAQAAGMPVVAVSYGYNYGVRLEDTGSDRVVDSLTELL
ncbi:phosphoglycolate phosphatase [Tamilnaduibacter salinus]|uniref:Phosphoglycolate phosphatase n=1 Tax=Tamilnaduibacter salinus TaxID=1484056 RepID=A0A2U1CWW8_9GAMM|nr:phosphoglycolate phosphatase [Tamilnaduibacter salinus]PVY76446.1 phosphoglycolate phosphatase [Tamilnaduibacter salinus]